MVVHIICFVRKTALAMFFVEIGRTSFYKGDRVIKA